MIFANRGDIDKVAFASLSDFVRENWNAISGFGYNKRHSEVIGAARRGDFDRFTALCRPRLVIAGHDFKFIEPAAKLLLKHFDIRYDAWRGHDLHDEKQSRELLDWAEVIWCEWMLGNAVWYSRNKSAGQRLVVRMHAMELQRDFGARLAVAAVDAIVSVSVYYFEKLIERFPEIPREKVRLIPNYADVPEYVSDFHADRLHTLAMIGIVGPGKGLLKAIDVLTGLRASDPRYTLKSSASAPGTSNGCVGVPMTWPTTIGSRPWSGSAGSETRLPIVDTQMCGPNWRRNALVSCFPSVNTRAFMLPFWTALPAAAWAHVQPGRRRIHLPAGNNRGLGGRHGSEDTGTRRQGAFSRGEPERPRFRCRPLFDRRLCCRNPAIVRRICVTGFLW